MIIYSNIKTIFKVKKMLAAINKKLYLSTLSGIFLEYFDYTLYAFAIVYISREFFPSTNPTAALILSWMGFGMSFLVRPFGAIVLGHFADRIGRRTVLISSIFFMSLATIGIGLIPSYTKIGIFSSILLFICRIIQGLFVSTEYSGSSTYLLECIPNQRGLNSGILTSVSGLGMFLASALFLLFGKHWQEGFIVAGLIVGALGLYSRISLIESPEFLQALKNHNIINKPFIKLLQNHFKQTLIGIIFSAYVGIAIVTVEIYLPNYLHSHFNISHAKASYIGTYILLTEALFAIACGYVTDQFGNKKVLIIGGGLMILFIYPLISLFHVNSVTLWYLTATILALLVALVDGPIAGFLFSLFPVQVRYTGISVCYNFGAALLGGFSPAVLLWLENSYRFSILPLYLLVSAVIFTCVAILNIKR